MTLSAWRIGMADPPGGSRRVQGGGGGRCIIGQTENFAARLGAALPDKRSSQRTRSCQADTCCQ